MRWPTWLITLPFALLCFGGASSAQGTDPIVGIASTTGGDSESWNQIIVTRAGNTYLGGYRWPNYVQFGWSPGPNVFESAGSGAGSAIVDVSESWLLAEDGTIYEAQSTGWRTVGNIAASASVPNAGGFIGFFAGGAWSGGIGQFPYAVTSTGTVFRWNTRTGPGHWEVAGEVSAPTEATTQSWGSLKAKHR